MSFKIIIVPVTPFQQNCSLLVDDDAESYVVVDPGGDIPKILAEIKLRLSGYSCTGIFLTHAHIDHAGGVSSLLAALTKEAGSTPKLYGHRDDAPLRASIGQQSTMFGLDSEEYQNCPEPDVFLVDNEEFSVGTIVGKVLFTPGHAPGHIALYFAPTNFELHIGQRAQRLKNTPVVIAGDTLFAGSIGRTDFPLCSQEVLVTSIKTKLLTLPNNTIVLPGHGPATTIATERSGNPFLSDS